MQRRLMNMIEEIDEQVGDKQCSLRDLLTDLQHVAAHMNLDFEGAVHGAQRVYLEEVEQKQWPL